MDYEKYFSTRQAEERYKLSASFLAKLRVSGGGPPFLKIGRRVLYTRDAFEDWLDQHQRGSTSDTEGAK